VAKVALLKKKVNQSSLTKHTLFVVCEIGSYNNFESSSSLRITHTHAEIHRVIEKDHQ